MDYSTLNLRRIAMILASYVAYLHTVVKKTASYPPPPPRAHHERLPLYVARFFLPVVAIVLAFAGPASAQSSNANLSGLTASNSTSQDGMFSALALAPSFSADSTRYTATVPITITHAKVTPTAAHTAATITVNGASVTSGSTSTWIELDNGYNYIAIQVTAEDGTKKTYNVIIHRQGSSMEFERDTEPLYEGVSQSLRVRLTKPLDQATTVDISISDSSTATETSDYALSTKTLSFAPGETVQTYTVTTVADQVTEGQETLILVLAAPAGALYTVGFPDKVEIQILDPPPPSTVSLSASQEGGTVTVKVTLSAALASDVAIPLKLTLTGPVNSAEAEQTVLIPAGETEHLIQFTHFVGFDDEGLTFTFALDTASLPASVQAGSSDSVTVTIPNNDSQEQVQGGGSADEAQTDSLTALTASFEKVPESHQGKGRFSFLVRLSETVGKFSKSPRKASFKVKRGRVQSVKQVEGGLWRVRISPSSKRAVKVTLAGGRDCDEKGAVCTPDGRPLSNTVSATIKGPPKAAGKLAVSAPVLAGNHPNPFNPTTTIKYALPQAADVVLTVYNIAGQPVQTLVAEYQHAGWHTVEWNADGLAAGLYFYQVQAGPFHVVEKMLLVK